MMENMIHIDATDTLNIHANDYLCLPEAFNVFSTLIPEYHVVEEIFRNDPELIFLGIQGQEVPATLREYPSF